MASLFKPAGDETAFLKMGLMGFAGSGKTFTATETAIGLVQMCRERGMDYAKRPAFFLDTEGGAGYVRDRFEAAGIELLVARTRAFSDLVTGINEAERTGSILLIDSITHFWEEWCETYKTQKKRSRGLEFSDWSYLKGQWRKGFTDRYLNSKLHIILCGRAGYEYEHYTDDAGKKQIEKSGIKMKAEGEMGYEPSLLVLMERDMDMDNDHAVSRTANVIKDRFRDLDGKHIRNPTFKSFLPHIGKLNLGGEQGAIDTTRTSAALVPDDPKREDNALRRDICIDEIQALMVKHYPSTSAADKQAKAALIETHFKTTSWTEIERVMSLTQLISGYDSMHIALEKKLSRYNKPEAPEVHDEIPTFDEAPAATPSPPQQEPATQASPPADHEPPAAAVGPDPAIQARADNIIERMQKAPNKTTLSVIEKQVDAAWPESVKAPIRLASKAARARLTPAANGATA